MIDHAISD